MPMPITCRPPRLFFQQLAFDAEADRTAMIVARCHGILALDDMQQLDIGPDPGGGPGRQLDDARVRTR